MNTSTETKHTATGAAEFARRAMAGALLASGIIAAAVGLAAPSHADGAPAPAGANCQTDRWGFMGSQRRTLCDGPVSPDGSWMRERTIWVPAHYTPSTCYSFGSSGTSCSTGYLVDQREVSSEVYPVRPDTVLSDEPGHLD